MTASSALVEPAWFTSPESAKTLGPEVADLCELAGFAPDPEQRLALDAIFGRNRDGTPSSDEAAVIAPRQNIKTGLFKQCALGWLFVTDQRLIIWSAHEFSTAQEAHRDIKELIEGCDWLRRRIYKIYDAHGQEGIELLTGQRVMFKARTRTGGRGLSGDKVVLDEAFALQPNHMGSLVPTMSARPQGQILYGSSAGLLESGILRSIRERGRAGNDPGLVYIEFCDDLPGNCQLGVECSHIVGSPGCRLDDVARWQRANSQLGRRISMAAIERERRSLPPAEFARERLGWWEDPAGGAGSAFDLEAWADLADPDAEQGVNPSFGVATAPDRSWAAVAVAWRRRDGLLQVMLADYRATATWVKARVNALRGRWGGRVGVDRASRGLLAEDTAEELSPDDLAQAENRLSDLVTAAVVRHGNEAALNMAVRGSQWKPSGETRLLDRKGDMEISPVVAASIAVWLADQGQVPQVHGWPSDEEIAEWEVGTP